MAIILSLLAISLSVYAIVDNKLKLQALDVRIKEFPEDEIELRAIDSLKAKVRAVYTNTKPGSYTIQIFNAGPGIARNVNIQFSPKDYNDFIDLSHFPCQKLNPRDSKEIYMNIRKGLPSTLAIKLRWDDENEFNNEHMQVISL